MEVHLGDANNAGDRVHLKARPGVSSALEANLVRVQARPPQVDSPQGLSGVWREQEQLGINTRNPGARNRQGETSGVREFVERAGDVKG